MEYVNPEYLQTLLHQRFHISGADRAAGERLARKLAEPFAELIREAIHLPNNIFPDPSADPKTLLRQGIEIFGPETDLEGLAQDQVLDELPRAKAAKGFYEKAELGAGALFEIARQGKTGDVAEGRRPLFDALEQAFAAGIDPNYQPLLDNMNPVERALFDGLLSRVQDLSNTERYQLALYLVEAYRSSVDDIGPRELGFIENHMNGDTFARGANSQFFETDYRYRSQDDNRLLFSVEFAAIDGVMRVIDSITEQPLIPQTDDSPHLRPWDVGGSTPLLDPATGRSADPALDDPDLYPTSTDVEPGTDRGDPASDDPDLYPTSTGNPDALFYPSMEPEPLNTPIQHFPISPYQDIPTPNDIPEPEDEPHRHNTGSDFG